MPPITPTIDWQITTVDIIGYSTWPSLAFSPSGQAAVAFHSSLYRGLRYATRNPGGSWDLGTVDTANADCMPSLRFRYGQAAISYSSVSYPEDDPAKSQRHLKFALNRGTGSPAWSITTIAPKGNDSSVAIGPSHQVGVSYQDKDNGVSYAEAGTGFSTWTGMQVAGEGNGTFNALAFAPSGQPAMVYSSRGANGDPDTIRYAAFDGAQWHSETVGEGGGWCSLAFAPSGAPAAAYVLMRSATDMSVIYAQKSGSAWAREAVAVNADSPYLAFTPSGAPAISYHDRAAYAVKYAVFADRAWQHFLVQKIGKDQNGVFHGDFTLTALAFSAAGQPGIAYYDRSDGSLIVAIGPVNTPLKDIVAEGPRDRALARDGG